MSTQKVKMVQILPVFMSFIVMGFVDIVGVSAGYAQKDFGLSDSIAQLIPSMAFVWFFLLSVPTGILLDKFGKKKIQYSEKFPKSFQQLQTMYVYLQQICLRPCIILKALVWQRHKWAY
jgi:MFS family permease